MIEWFHNYASKAKFNFFESQLHFFFANLLCTVCKSHSLIHSFIGKIQLSYTVSFVLQVSTPEYNAYGLAAGIGEKIWVPFYVQVPPDSITDMEVRTSLFVVVYIYILQTLYNAVLDREKAMERGVTYIL